jgi:uncharacterized lipoprotein YmbA
VAVACLLAAGCGSTQPARFYMLDDTPSSPTTETGTGEQVLLVGPINIPPHLERSQIARSTGGPELVYEEYHRWAEDLSAGILRVLRAELAAQMPETVVTPFTWVRSAPYEYRVPVNILAFSGVPGREATLSAQWAFTSDRGRTTLITRTSTFTAKPEADGYEALVRAQSELVKQLAREIAQALPAVAQQQQDQAED